jgi:hypothetical protein
MAAVSLAFTADALTAARLGLAVLLVPLLATGRTGAAGLVLGIAWITDALDGRAARAGSAPTRLGELDLAVDTAVGAAALGGLALAGFVPPPAAVGVLVVFGGLYLVTRNDAASAIVQAAGYGGVIFRLWLDGSSVRWWPVLVAATIGVLDREKLFRETLPGFFVGIGQLARLPRAPRRRA